jgi:Protein of unknown function (DUF3325)
MIAFGALVGFSLTLERHQQEVLGRLLSGNVTRVLKLLAWVAFLVGYACLVISHGWLLGTVGWFGELTIGALTVVVLITFRPKITIPLALIGLVIGLALVTLDQLRV